MRCNAQCANVEPKSICTVVVLVINKRRSGLFCPVPYIGGTVYVLRRMDLPLDVPATGGSHGGGCFLVLADRLSRIGVQAAGGSARPGPCTQTVSTVTS
jgi:hypothetical protein